MKAFSKLLASFHQFYSGRVFKRFLKTAPFLFVLAVFLFFHMVFFKPFNKRGALQAIDVPPGQTFYQLADELEKNQLICSAFYFKVLVWLFQNPPLFVGEYQLSPAQSLWVQFYKIRRGEVLREWITFSEGLNHYEMSLLLKSRGWLHTKEFLKLVWDKDFIRSLLNENVPSLEGYLFPETYPISKYKPAKQLLREMTGEFLKVYKQVKANQGERGSSAFSRNEIVTLASLIEKETGQASERPLISGVFHNRLKRNMKLQADPSILYSLFLKQGFERGLAIGKKEILFPSPYNTYVVRGLPPGPIANPGKKSLEAAFSPARTPYLYFVSRNDGSHVFSKSLKEHKKAVYQYQIVPFKKKQAR